MSFFKKTQKPLIPPVVDSSYGSNTSSPAPSYRSTTSTYTASRDDGPRNTTSADFRDRFHRNAPVGDVYSRGAGHLDNDRSELFSGYKPEKIGSGRFFDGPPRGKTPPPGEENDEDVEGIKQTTRFMKQESVNSTRNALRMAREAEDTARNTLTKLGDQSEKLANTERHLDVAKGHSTRAGDKTDELKQLNRSIFRPVITFNKDAKRAAQDAKIQARYEEEREEREKAMSDVRDTHNRLGRAASYGRGDGDDEGLTGPGGVRGRFKSEEQLLARREERKRYQFEATASDDEAEDELDNNLDEISDATKRLKALGVAMGEELGKQNDRIDRLDEKTVSLDNKIFKNTERLKRIK